MKQVLVYFFCLAFYGVYAQDEQVIIKTPQKPKAEAVKIFNSERTIIANTTEIVAKGYWDFKVTHNFSDLAGEQGGPKSFFGLDNSTDIRIGFHFGLTDRLNLTVARAKGGGIYGKTRVNQLYELGLKYQLARQLENDPSHPVAITLFANNVISSMNSDYTSPKDVNGNPTDTALNYPYTFKNFGERMSQVLQAIIARKIGRSSILMNFTMVHHDYVPLNDEKTIFAIGGTIKVPLTKSINLMVDYIHPFRSQSSKDYFKLVDNSFNPPGDIDKNATAFNFYDPLGIGFEIVTEGHVFHLNFTNATEILDNRLIPYTNSSWGKGQFRWAFNISRKFTLSKKKKSVI
jgi:hypothetical protein